MAGTPLFVFGTLMDGDVQEVVLGAHLPTHAMEPAVIQGFRRVFVAGRTYPMLLPHSSGWVQGVLIHDLGQAAFHRLQAYEGWEYRLEPVRVTTLHGHALRAVVFMSQTGIKPSRRSWSLPLWRLRHKRNFLRKAAHFMDHYPTQAALRRLRRSI
ncbi:gamma-glutamylcyclotransferase family protein [Telmatospirillum sp. J64-1]|uniref:gamma-glutamylcyclotransferase family protein n=1 Tax=Telmatospirillum sp. J64-1 TaxID=2502183 RepID=UPI0021083B67|nr:gamma-glutamylcyclotransferase family protein [Telmatospirillum sp. J64-1]